MNDARPPKTLRAASALGLALALATAAGCGDETQRMAGTLDFPDRSTARPDMKQAAGEAKAKAKAERSAARER